MCKSLCIIMQERNIEYNFFIFTAMKYETINREKDIKRYI